MAALFGPVMVVWFAVITVGGLVHVVANPDVLVSVNPWYGIRFLVSHGLVGLTVLGLVFLAVTGAEALYADLGHFGRKPIQIAWFALVLPSLIINYFGQGALVLARPEAIENPFYLLYPEWALVPDGHPRDARDHHRQPGGDHRRFLADTPGDPARLVASLRHHAHIRNPSPDRSTCRA